MSGSRRHIAVDLGASGGRVIEVVVSEESIATRVLHRFANAPVATARAGNLRLCWPFERIFEEILEGLRRAAADGAVDSIGIDSWAVDYALLDDAGEVDAPGRGALVGADAAGQPGRPESDGSVVRPDGRLPQLDRDALDDSGIAVAPEAPGELR